MEKNRVRELLDFFSHHFPPMSGTLFFFEHLNWQVGSVLLKAPRPPPPPDPCKLCTESGGGPPPSSEMCKNFLRGDPSYSLHISEEGGGPPPPRKCKIGLAGEALYYYTLLYWGEGSGQYNCRTTWSWLVKVKLLKLCRTTRSYPSELLCALVV